MKFNHWKVISLYSKGTNQQTKWVCECDLCHQTYIVSSSSLTRGTSTKCKYCAYASSKKTKYTHDPIQYVFKGMKQRCYNPNAKSFKNYGGKGITICSEWLNNPLSFYDWAYSNGYAKGMSIERLDNTKGYSPQNCIFIPKNEQNKNRSNSIIITIGEETKCLSAWCREKNIYTETVKARVRKKGMSWEEALNLPINASYSRYKSK